MTTYNPAHTRHVPPASSVTWIRIKSEFVSLARALVMPGRLVIQVERMRALQLQALQIEAFNPARAAALRRAATRCLQG